MKIGDAFPSTYLKTEDLNGKRIAVTIDRVEVEDLGFDDKKETKPVLYFQGKEKGLVLNRTNADAITALYGEETDDWTGKKIVLHGERVTFKGKSVMGIRISPPPGYVPPVEEVVDETADESAVPF